MRKNDCLAIFTSSIQLKINLLSILMIYFLILVEVWPII